MLAGVLPHHDSLLVPEPHQSAVEPLSPELSALPQRRNRHPVPGKTQPVAHLQRLPYPGCLPAVASHCEPGTCCQDNVGAIVMLPSTLLLAQHEVRAPVVQQCPFVCRQAGRTPEPRAMCSPVVWQCHL